MKRILPVLLLALPMSAFGWTVSVGTWVCNPDASVAVPIEIDDATGLAYAAVRVNYDPQVLVCLRVEPGGLEEAFDGDFLVSDGESGTLAVARFRASEGVAGSGGGTLARAVFTVRPGTARQYSDLAIADIRLGDAGGVRDLALAGPIEPSGGMVRIFPENGAVARLEGAQTIAAKTRLAALRLAEGDAIQAATDGEPIVVDGATEAAGAIPVRAPEGGWRNAPYALLKTSTRGLSFVAADGAGETLEVEESEEDGLWLYSLRVETGEGPEVVSGEDDETLGTAAIAYVQGLFSGAEGVAHVTVFGGEKNVLLASALGIRPSTVTNGITVEATFAEPSIEITDYDMETGVVKVRVTPGAGNSIGNELAKGVVRLRGGATPGNLTDLSQTSFTLDTDAYLDSETMGEFSLRDKDAVLDFGTTTFFRIAIFVENP
jgi:hypothetical protein